MNDILTEEEVAELLGCTVETVQEKARTSVLPAIKFGRSWRFPRGALLHRLDQLALAPVVPPASTLAVYDSVRGKSARTLPKLPELI